eukprot:XP_001704376.1 Hypothetical protein GL50803_38279 [Giardia lamblia ATCC 50803]
MNVRLSINSVDMIAKTHHTSASDVMRKPLVHHSK